MKTPSARLLASLLAYTAIGGCRPVRLPVPDLDPGATFAAHQVHNGFVIDRIPDGGAGVIEPAGWVNWGSPQFRVRVEGVTLADLSLMAPARVEVRESNAPGAGRVEPAWDDGAVRLTVRSTTGALLQFGVFERIGGGGGYSALSRNAQTLLDVQGTYRSMVVDGDAHPVGWWQLRIAEPFRPRVFEGAVAELSPALAGALTLALNSEIDWVENHTLDVFRGSSSGRFDGHTRGGH
jgi:hypothetical protein